MYVIAYFKCCTFVGYIATPSHSHLKFDNIIGRRPKEFALEIKKLKCGKLLYRPNSSDKYVTPRCKVTVLKQCPDRRSLGRKL